MAYWFDFRTMMMDLQHMGVLDVLLPFILIFTIVFCPAEKQDFGTGRKQEAEKEL